MFATKLRKETTDHIRLTKCNLLFTLHIDMKLKTLKLLCVKFPL